MTDLVATKSGLLVPTGTSVQPITEDFSTDGLLNEYAKVDHQHPLSPSLRAAIFGQNTAGVANKNLVDNGAMNVCQRNPAGPGAYVAGGFTLDRWAHNLLTLGTYTWAQQVDAPLNSEFLKGIKLTCTVANAAPAAGAYNNVATAIEGIFLQHLLWGVAAAKPLTASFWVKGSTVGNYVCELYRSEGAGRSISALYTINVANTWEYKTITFPGDVNTAITNAADARLSLVFWLGAGSNYTSGGVLQTAWGTTVTNRAVGGTNLSAAANNTIQFTGVQLEIGSKASLFESRRYDLELERCRRYLYIITALNIPLGPGHAFAAGAGQCYIPIPTPLRATPTLTAAGVAGNYSTWTNAGVAIACTALPIFGSYVPGSTMVDVRTTVAAGMVAGDITTLYINNAAGILSFLAEI